MRPGKWIFIVPAAVVGMVLVSAIGGGIVRLLWNWLLPPLFGWREVTFPQAFGLLVLCRVLFGGIGRHSFPRYTSRMTPEERARFRQRIMDRVGFKAASERVDF